MLLLPSLISSVSSSSSSFKIMRKAGLEEAQAGIPDRVQLPGPSLSGGVISDKLLVL